MRVIRRVVSALRSRSSRSRGDVYVSTKWLSDHEQQATKSGWDHDIAHRGMSWPVQWRPEAEPARDRG